MTKQVLACVVSAMTLISCSSDDSSEKAMQIISHAKAAMGGDAWNDIQIWYEEGETIGAAGAVSRYVHWGDLNTLGLRNVNSQGDYMVFDGKAAYQCADSECTSRTALDVMAVKGGAYVVSYGFFFPDRFATALKYLGVREEKHVQYDVVQATPVGLDPIQVWVDQDTHLVSRVVFEKVNSRTDFSDYRRVGGILVPFVVAEDGMTAKTATVRFYPHGAVAFTPAADSSVSHSQ